MRLPGILLYAVITFAFAAAGAGCSFFNPPDTPEPGAVSTPNYVTDLSTLSAQPINPIMDPSAAFAATHASSTGGSERATEEAPGTTRHVGPDQSPGTEKLMNPKAGKFASFSGTLVDRLWHAVFKQEQGERMSRINATADLQPVVLTATLDPSGKLKEIVLEQHSGKGLVDRMFIDAAKSALWADNPPKEAAMPDGFYRVRVELRIQNFASTDTHKYFTTWVGLALL
ncbi:MAG: energy transducer TonB [Candidatus Binataceae bacterium]